MPRRAQTRRSLKDGRQWQRGRDYRNMPPFGPEQLIARLSQLDDRVAGSLLMASALSSMPIIADDWRLQQASNRCALRLEAAADLTNGLAQAVFVFDESEPEVTFAGGPEAAAG